MSVVAQNCFNLFQGDGITTLFNWTFALPAGSNGSEIQVFVIDNLGNITQLTSNFSLNLNLSQVTYPVQGGVAPLAAGVNALPAGWQIAIYRTEPLTQSVALTTQGPFFAASLMAALDYLTFITQQLAEQINRCVKYPIGQVPANTNVQAFIAAVSAIIQPPSVQGTLAYCKSIAVVKPQVQQFFIVTDQGGGNALFWYSGSPTSGPNQDGFFGPLAGS